MALLPALLLIFAPPLAARPQRTPPGPPADWIRREETKLFTDQDLKTAAELPGDPRFARMRRSDPVRRAYWLAQAVELTGLARMLRRRGKNLDVNHGLVDWYDDPAGFAAQPRRFVAWARREVPEADATTVALAILDWSVLPEDGRRFLENLGISEPQWEGKAMSTRWVKLAPWARAKHREAVRMFRAQYKIDHLRVRDLHMTDPDEGQPYEPLESKGTVGGAEAPPVRPQAAQSSSQDARLAALLEPRILAGLDAVPMGRRALDFYRDQPLVLSVGQEDGEMLARFDPLNHRIIINAGTIADWLSEQDRARADLFEDGKLLDQLATYLQPIFIHEAEHQRAWSWREPISGADDLYSRQDEVDAMLAEGAFFAQERQVNPDYLRPTGALDADATIDMANTCSLEAQAGDLAGLESRVASWYVNVGSRDSVAARLLSERAGIVHAIRKELARRAGAPSFRPPKAALPVPADLFLFSWRPFIKSAPSGELRRLGDEQAKELLKAADAYLEIRRRHPALIAELFAQAAWIQPPPPLPRKAQLPQ